MATSVIGTWASQGETAFSRRLRWTGPGDIDDSTWKTPDIDLDHRPWNAFVYLYGSGAAGGSAAGKLDAWGLWPDLTGDAGSNDDILPRQTIQWIGLNGALSEITDLASMVDATAIYTNGWWLANVAPSASGGMAPVILAPNLFFLYTGTVADGDATLEYIDLILTPAWRS